MVSYWSVDAAGNVEPHITQSLTLSYEPDAAITGTSGAADRVDWVPTSPSIAVPTDLAELDVFEIQVYDREAGARLVAVC